MVALVKKYLATAGGDRIIKIWNFDMTEEFKKSLIEKGNLSLKLNINTLFVEKLEGHTDNVPYPQLDADPYFANLILSQQRALNVMQFIRNLPEYQQYSEADKELLEYWFTANGLSYGRALDDQSNYVHKTKREINKNKSRRVEFRLITAGEEMLEEFVDKTR